MTETNQLTREQIALIQWECQQLLNRLTNLLDAREWQALANLYTEDATLYRPSDPDNAIVGREAIYQSFIERKGLETCHVLANTVFDVQSEHEVQAKSRVWLVAGEIDESSTLPISSNGKLLIGSFLDKLVRIDDAWFVSERKGTIELKHHQ